MCLGVPGRVIKVQENELGTMMGIADFGGIRKEVCLAYVPGVRIGEYVIVHVGFAISRIDEREAAEVFRLLEEIGELESLRDDAPSADPGQGG
jgi:hydrogenase expression/formation protein HypC